MIRLFWLSLWVSALGCGVSEVYFPAETQQRPGEVTTGSASTGGARKGSSGGSASGTATGGSTSTSTSGGTSAGAVPIVTTVAGNGNVGWADGSGGRTGEAEFGWPMGIGLDANGRIYVADDWDSLVRAIDLEGNVTTLAGGAGSASLHNPVGLAVKPDGSVFVAGSVILEIDPLGNLTTLPAGESDGLPFSSLMAMALDASGNLFVGDTFNNRVCVIDLAGNVSTLAGGPTSGYANGSGQAALFNQPWGLAVDDQENVYVADSQNNVIRKIDSRGNVTTFAGSGVPGWVDGPADSAELDQPAGLALDLQGNVIVADANNNRIRRVDPEGNVETIAGNGQAGDADGTGGPDGSASFLNPWGVAVDQDGSIYVGGNNDHRVRRITFGR